MDRWNRILSPEVVSHINVRIIMDKGQSLLINDVEITEHPHRDNLDPFIEFYTKMNIKWE